MEKENKSVGSLARKNSKMCVECAPWQEQHFILQRTKIGIDKKTLLPAVSHFASLPAPVLLVPLKGSDLLHPKTESEL